MRIEISDYDGIISLVNSATYKAYVAENWKLEQLKGHFIQQMNLNNIVVWQTNNNGGGNWNIELTFVENTISSHSEFTKLIEVTESKLYLADYTDLTMAAQFQQYGIPAKGHEKQVFEVENGVYEIKVKRLFDPEEEFEEEKLAFEIIFTKSDSNKERSSIDKIFWWTF